MNQKQFLDELRIHLQELPEADLHEILLDYEEHFNIGHSEGRSEEEIVEELGTPASIAEDIWNEREQDRNSFKENEYVQTEPIFGQRKASSSIFKTIAKSIFVIFPLSILAIVCGSVFISLSFASVVLILSSIAQLGAIIFDASNAFLKVCVSMVAGGLGVLLGVAMIRVWQFFRTFMRNRSDGGRKIA